MKCSSHKITAAKDAAANLAFRGRNLLSGNAGEGYIDTAIKILLAVVIGALPSGLYACSGNGVPTLTQRIKEMFNYAG